MLDPRCQPGCCPRSPSNRASGPAQTPPWQQQGRGAGRRQPGDTMAAVEAEKIRGCSAPSHRGDMGMLRTHSDPTEEQWLPAIPLLRHSRGETQKASQEPRPTKPLLKLSQLQQGAPTQLLLPQDNRDQLRFPHFSGRRHQRYQASRALSQSSNRSSEKEYNDHSKHAVKLPPTHTPSFSAATSLGALS